MAWHLVRRQLAGAAELEVTNASLEARVARRARRWLRATPSSGAFERVQAAGEERERIYRDLHDDVGARLLSLVYATPDDASRSLARDALAELRELVAHSGAEPGLLSVLADRLAEEVATRARRAGLECEVELAIDATPRSAPWRSGTSRASCARRSRTPSSMRGRARCARRSQRMARITVQLLDDGVGGLEAGRGRGVRNMQVRADELRARLSFDAGPEGIGTCVRLSVEHGERAAPQGVSRVLKSEQHAGETVSSVFLGQLF